MRLFVGIRLDDEPRALLGEEAERLKLIMQGNFSAPENYHVTLAFLGQHESGELDDIRAAVKSAARFAPFNLVLEGMGGFKKGNRQVVWHGVNPAPELMQMQRRLASELRARGVAFDDGEYHPHITLARQCPIVPLPPREKCANTHTYVRKITLFESKRVDGVLTYVPIYEAMLDKNA